MLLRFLDLRFPKLIILLLRYTCNGKRQASCPDSPYDEPPPITGHLLGLPYRAERAQERTDHADVREVLTDRHEPSLLRALRLGQTLGEVPRSRIERGQQLTTQNDSLFEESSQGAVSAVTAFAFVLALILFFGGLVLSSYGFGAGENGMLLFVLGLASSTLGFLVPFAILPATGK